jgi:hypothetical protein
MKSTICPCCQIRERIALEVYCRECRNLKARKDSLKYYGKNRETILVKQRKYNKTLRSHQLLTIDYHNRKTALLNSSKLTTEKLEFVDDRNIKHFGIITCELCFQPILFGEEELEHFTAVARHKDFPTVDLNALENLGIAHGKKSKERCNQKKLDKTLDEWFALHPEYNRSKAIAEILS